MTSLALASRPADFGMDEKHHMRTCQLATTDYISFAAMDCKTPSVTKADNIMTVDLRYRERNNCALDALNGWDGRGRRQGSERSDPQVLGDLEYLIARFDEACIG